MSFIEFFILALAAWRLTNLLVNEDGPLDIFLKLREYLGVYHSGGYEEYLEKPVYEQILVGLFQCIWCMSVWVSGVICLFAWFFGAIPIQWMPPYILAVSTSVIVADKFIYWE